MVKTDTSYERPIPPAGFKEMCRQPFGRTTTSNQKVIPALDDQLLDTGYAGALEVLEIDHYGTISVEHGNILEMDADAILIGVPPNLTPYGGLGLQLLERGGKKLITALVKRAKAIIAERMKAIEDMREQFKSPKEYESAIKEFKALQIGDVILTPPFGATRATVIGFVITPFFLETSSRDAVLKVRHVVKTALEQVNRMGISNLLMPLLSDSISGYEPIKGAQATIEEAYEVITQADSPKPVYAIKQLRLVHKQLGEARNIAKALIEVAHEKRPELEVQPAAVYFSRATQRLIEFDESVLKFCSQTSKITYKKHSVVRKSKRMHWIRNIKPYVWRPGRYNAPPPLLVYRATGTPAHFQLGPRPFYKDKLSHVLFPLLRKPIKATRISLKGRLVGQPKQDPIFRQCVEL
uniref:Macro domain-containing protein n=2 Tax=Babesia bovis TaxID=5865 RepID=A7AWY4_BABBO|eukprot:XP_001609130.1 hypothetical protein [Babesia bovis T2Bo]